MFDTAGFQPQLGELLASREQPFADILCAVDGTRRSFAAVEQAAILAGPQGHLMLLAVTAVTGAGAYRNAAISPPRAEHVVERAAEIATRRGVPCRSVVEESGPPPQAILERAGAHDLLALGAPSTSWLGEKLFEGVTLPVMAALSRPLLASRTMLSGAGGFCERILVASDGLRESDELIGLAARLAREHGARVIVLHATDHETQARTAHVESQAEQLTASLDAEAELRIEIGGAAEAIEHAARESESSLVLMGTRRLRGLKALGSVSRQVIHGAHCSVLIVPPPDAAG